MVLMPHLVGRVVMKEKSRAKSVFTHFRDRSSSLGSEKINVQNYGKTTTAKLIKGKYSRFSIIKLTELDIWQYIYLENIDIVPLYFAKHRPVIERDGTLDYG